MKVIYDLLEKADGIKLAPELLEPEPPRSSNDFGLVPIFLMDL